MTDLQQPEPQEPKPYRGPPEFCDEDTARADELIDAILPIAARAVDGAPTDPAALEKTKAMYRGANRVIGDGRAAAGTRVNDLAAAADYSGDTHVREPFGPWTRAMTDFGVRMLVARRMPAIVEHLSVRPVEIRPGSRRIGGEAHGSRARKSLINVHVGSIEAQLESCALPFAKGTPYDHTDPSADASLIAEAEAAMGCPVPGDEAEHYGLVLRERARRIEQARALAVGNRDALTGLGLQADTLVERMFSPLTVLEAMLFGAPQQAGEFCRARIYPGRRDDLVKLALDAGLIGIAYWGDAARVGAPRSGRRRGAQLTPETTAEFALAPDWGVSFAVGPGPVLLRTVRSGTATRTSAWVVFGMDPWDQRALALAQRTGEGWAEACRRRAEEQRPAGTVYPKGAGFRLCMLDMLRLADAARICAERERQARDMFS